MKRTTILLLISFFPIITLSQEVLIFGAFGDHMNFEDSLEYDHIKIDTNNIWLITHPQKSILNLPPLGSFCAGKGIITDTNLYYHANSFSFFQFRLFMDGSNAYELIFYHKYDLEMNIDGGIIETSWDDGVSWQNLIFDTLIMNNVFDTQNMYTAQDTIWAFNNQPGFTGFQDSLVLSSITFWSNFEINYDTLLLRYTFKSDSVNTDNEGWMLDEFQFGGFLVGIEDNYEPSDQLIIYPNPVYDRLSISLNNEDVYNVRIYSMLGVKIAEYANSKTIFIGDIPIGLYIIEVNDKYRKKFIKK